MLENDCGLNDDYFAFWKYISYLSEASRGNDDALLIKGYYFLETGYFNRAIKCYDLFLENHKNDKRAISGKMCSFNEMDEFDYAKKHSNLFNSIQWKYLLSEIALVENKPKEAMKILGGILKNDKEDVEAILRKAICYYVDLKFDNALVELDEVLKINPDNVDATVLKGEILAGLHRYDEAIGAFNELHLNTLPEGYEKLMDFMREYGENNAGFFSVYKFSSHWEYAYVESDIFKRIKSQYLDQLEFEVQKRGLAWKGVNRALQMKSTTQNKINHALNEELLYDFDEQGYENMVPITENSIKLFDKILKSDPKNIVALNNKGCIFLEFGNLDDALDCFRNALKIDSTDYHIWFNKAFVYLNGGEYFHAKDCFDMYFELNDNLDSSFYVDLSYYIYDIGWKLYESGRYLESIKCYDLCIKFCPDISNFWNCKAISQSCLNQFQEALFNYDKALEIEPNDDILIGNKVSCLLQYIDYSMESKDYMAAIGCFKKLLTMKEREYAWQSRLMKLIEICIDQGCYYFEIQNYTAAIMCFDEILPIVLDDGVRENILLYKYKCLIEIMIDDDNERPLVCILYLITCLKELLTVNSNNISYFEDLIFCLLSINDVDEALRYCDEGMEIHPALANLKMHI